MSGYLVGAALVVTAIGTGYSIDQQRKAGKKQEAANLKSQRIEAVRSQRERVAAVRQNRVQAAQVFAQAGNVGATQSSGVQGAIGSLQSTTAANIGFANTVDNLRTQREALLSGAQTRLNNAQIGTQITGSISSGLMAASGG